MRKLAHNKNQQLYILGIILIFIVMLCLMDYVTTGKTSVIGQLQEDFENIDFSKINTNVQTDRQLQWWEHIPGMSQLFGGIKFTIDLTYIVLQMMWISMVMFFNIITLNFGFIQQNPAMDWFMWFIRVPIIGVIIYAIVQALPFT